MSAEPIHIPRAEVQFATSADRNRAELDIAVKGFLARYRVAHTRYSYGLALRQWIGWCDEHFVDPLHGATRAHIEIFARELEMTGRQLSTVAAKLNALAGFYRYAHADEIIAKDPMLHVQRPHVERVSTTLGLTRPELADLLNAAEASGLQDGALMCILGLNGMRVSEATGIDVEHLGKHRGQTTVQILRKGGKHQTLGFAYRTAWAIEQLAATRDGGPLFLTRTGTRMDRKAAGRVVTRLCHEIGVTRRIHPHSLRHTFVTLSRDAGVPDRDIINDTGHADSRMVEYYDRGRGSLRLTATHALAAFVERAG